MPCKGHPAPLEGELCGLQKTMADQMQVSWGFCEPKISSSVLGVEARCKKSFATFLLRCVADSLLPPAGKWSWSGRTRLGVCSTLGTCRWGIKFLTQLSALRCLWRSSTHYWTLSLLLHPSPGWRRSGPDVARTESWLNLFLCLLWVFHVVAQALLPWWEHWAGISFGIWAELIGHPSCVAREALYISCCIFTHQFIALDASLTIHRINSQLSFCVCVWLWCFILYLFLYFLGLETDSLLKQPWLAWNSLYRPGWLGFTEIHMLLPHESMVVWATMLCFTFAFVLRFYLWGWRDGLLVKSTKKTRVWLLAPILLLVTGHNFNSKEHSLLTFKGVPSMPVVPRQTCNKTFIHIK